MICSIKTIKELFWDVKIWWTPAREKAEYFWWGIPWVSIKDMEGKKEIFETNETLSKLWVKNSNVKLIKRWSLLFSFKLTVGRMCFAWVDLYTNEAIAAFEPNKHINLEYLYYILPVVANKVDRTNNYGAPLLNKNVIKSLQIPLPPLATQQKIVEKLDEVSAVIKENQEKIRGQIVALDELWESKLDEVFSNEEWKKVKLEEVSEFGPKKAEVKNLDQETLVSFVPMADLNEHQIDFTVNEVRKLKEVYSGYTYFTENDVLLAKVTPCFENGKSWIAKNLENGIGFGSSEYFVYRPKEKLILSEWIYYCISSRQFIEEWKNNMSWAVWLQRVTKEYAKEYKLPLPPLSTQKAIVEELDELQKGITELKTQYTTQLEQYDELRNSLLDQAFKGELVK